MSHRLDFFDSLGSLSLLSESQVQPISWSPEPQSSDYQCREFNDKVLVFFSLPLQFRFKQTDMYLCSSRNLPRLLLWVFLRSLSFLPFTLYCCCMCVVYVHTHTHTHTHTPHLSFYLTQTKHAKVFSFSSFHTLVLRWLIELTGGLFFP